MNFVFGELYLQRVLPMDNDRMVVGDNAGRMVEVEQGETIFIGYNENFRTFQLQFDHTALDDGREVIVSTDEQRYQFRDLCLIIKVDR